jgi:hypothetical protein
MLQQLVKTGAQVVNTVLFRMFGLYNEHGIRGGAPSRCAGTQTPTHIERMSAGGRGATNASRRIGIVVCLTCVVSARLCYGIRGPTTPP